MVFGNDLSCSVDSKPLFYPFQAKLSSQTSCGRMSMVTIMAIIGVRDMNLRAETAETMEVRNSFFYRYGGPFLEDEVCTKSSSSIRISKRKKRWSQGTLGR